MIRKVKQAHFLALGLVLLLETYALISCVASVVPGEISTVIELSQGTIEMLPVHRGQGTEANFLSSDAAGVLIAKFDPSWLIERGRGLIMASGDSALLYLTPEVLRELQLKAAGEKVEVTLGRGNLGISIADDGAILSVGSFEHPVLLGLPCQENSDGTNVVMYQDIDEQEPKHLIPRSWCEGGMLYALVRHTGVFGAQDMGISGFGDTAGRWMEEAVEYMAARMVVTGEEQGIFSPRKRVTGLDFLTMLMRAFDRRGVESDTTIYVKEIEGLPVWERGIAAEALASSIVDGTEGWVLALQEPIQRYAMFTMAFRMMAEEGIIELSQGGMVLREFEDSVDIPESAYMTMLTLVQLGIIKGYARRLNPLAVATKAEAAQLIFNVLKYDADLTGRELGGPNQGLE